MAHNSTVFCFGPFSLDAARRQLLRGRDPVKLYPKEFDTLLALVERSGEVVGKDELFRRVWPDSVVEEGNLTTYVSHLRKVLGGAPQLRDYIVTVPGRGYQFVAPVTVVPNSAAAPNGDPRAQPRVRRLLASGALAVIVVAVAIFATRTSSVAPPSFQQLTFQRGTIGSARFAPDGGTIVYSAAWNGEPARIFATRLGSPESRPLGHDGDLLSISPSGELAFSMSTQFVRRWERSGVLARAGLEGGTPREVLNNVKEAEWSTDGRDFLVVKRRQSSDVIEFPEGTPRYEVQGFIMQPRIERTSGAVAFLQRRNGDESVEMLEREGTHRTLAAGLSGVTGLSWSASGREVLFSVSAGGETELHAVTPAGVRRLVMRTAGEWTLNDVGPDGRMLITQHHVRGYTVGAHGAEPDRDLSWLDRSVAAALSPDGTFVVLAEIGAGGGAKRSIYLRKMDGSPAVRLGDGEPAALSPDGKWVAAIQGASPERLVLLPAAAGHTRSLPNGAISDYYRVKWLPDNRHLVFGGIEPGRERRVYIQDTEGGAPAPVPWRGGVAETVFLPGRSYVARNGSAYELGSIDGGAGHVIPQLSGDDHVIQAGIAGKSVFVLQPHGTRLVLDLLDLESGRRIRIKEIVIQDPAGVSHPGPEFPLFLITPDGNTYVYSYVRVLSALYIVDRLE